MAGLEFADELQEREWQLFESIDHWTTEQRDAWRKAWIAWRKRLDQRLINGESQLRVWIESECIACFDCEIMCPELFTANGKRSQIKASAMQRNENAGPHINPDLIEENYDKLNLARDACPTEAISISINNTNDPEPLPTDFI